MNAWFCPSTPGDPHTIILGWVPVPGPSRTTPGSVVALVIGLRLLLLSARTRELPEFLVGVAVLFLAGLGFPFSAMAREVRCF